MKCLYGKQDMNIDVLDIIKKHFMKDNDIIIPQNTSFDNLFGNIIPSEMNALYIEINDKRMLLTENDLKTYTFKIDITSGVVSVASKNIDNTNINSRENEIDITFDEKQPTPLCEIMGRNRSDKGHLDIINCWHNYTTLYYKLFAPLRERKLRIFELGLGTTNIYIPANMGIYGRPGASHYGWAEFFPNADIFGADIDTDILFNNDRIKTFFCDQTKPIFIEKMWFEPALEENFDIIIDDGLHTFKGNSCFFENSIHKLNPNGYYIIEDITIKEEQLYIEKIKEWENKYTDCLFIYIKIPSERNDNDNNLIVVFKKPI